MQDLAETMAGLGSAGGLSGSDCDIARQAAIRWATYALTTHKGNLLRCSLEISRALVEWACELETPTDEG